MKKFLWRLIFKLLKCQKENYIIAIPWKSESYIVDIHKFVPVEEELSRWMDAFEKSKA